MYKSSNSETVEHTNHSAIQKHILSTGIAWTLLCIYPQLYSLVSSLKANHYFSTRYRLSFIYIQFARCLIEISEVKWKGKTSNFQAFVGQHIRHKNSYQKSVL